MRDAPPHAGPRTASAHVNGGEEVGEVGVKSPNTLDEVG
jgi:hypothetical protein